MVGRKKEPLILEANKRGEMSVTLGGWVNVPQAAGARPESGSVLA